MIEEFNVKFAGTLQLTVDDWENCLPQGGGEKKRFQYCLNPYSSDKFLCFRAIQGHSRGTLVDPTLQDNVLLLDDFAEYIYHIGNAFEMHSIIKKWPNSRRKKPQKRQATSVLHSRGPDGY